MTETTPARVREHRNPLGKLTHLDDIECEVCARKLPGLLVRIATGVCTLCERVTGPKRVGM
ncbi:hypothetical protein QSJ18_18355 [Gordonia sp. ABSL1-1]|uniref:hypothetical protein n=1 Tax=Gordonia sp. ABSL1-1 TaxID=3053923 RepID=UPI0025724986|nr:hypothetical protein [Gordonia sp. ABSL1-1]MDL9938713.1 hypothetical protein [Gordonia sp. ABSL1-1]